MKTWPWNSSHKLSPLHELVHSYESVEQAMFLLIFLKAKEEIICKAEEGFVQFSLLIYSEFKTTKHINWVE